jgi:hypothetical protein
MQKMKQILTAIILSCVLLTSHAGSRCIYGRVQGYTSWQYLYSDTGEEIGYFPNNYLYDSKAGQEIGYLSNGYLYSSRDGSILGYCDGQ